MNHHSSEPPLSLGYRPLPKARRDLRALVSYLIRIGHCESLGTIRLEHNDFYDGVNLADPRAFCYVQSNSPTIFCSKAIEDVNPSVRVAILLHEIVHLGLDAMKGAGSEVDVDSWIIQNIPESGYRYDTHEYDSSVAHRIVQAKNVQHVSSDFLRVALHG